jgi:hypothetical protein
VVRGDTLLGYIVAVYEDEPYALMIPMQDFFSALNDTYMVALNSSDAAHLPEYSSSAASPRSDVSMASVRNLFSASEPLSYLPTRSGGGPIRPRVHSIEMFTGHTISGDHAFPEMSCEAADHTQANHVTTGFGSSGTEWGAGFRSSSTVAALCSRERTGSQDEACSSSVPRAKPSIFKSM